MDVKPEDRQHVIDIWTEALVQHGMDEDRAEDYATQVVDETIQQAKS